MGTFRLAVIPARGGSKRIPPWKGLRQCTDFHIDQLADETLLEILEYLDFEEMTAFARAWSRIRQLITNHDVIRQRELQCFTLKRNYHECELGVGVAVSPARSLASASSSFASLALSSSAP